MIENLKEIKKEELLDEVKRFMDEKMRFVTAVCSDLGDKFEVTYFFNHSPGMEMKALRMTVGKDEEVPSISGVCLTAVLIENEMKELFGLNVKDLAIDFGGYMLLAQDSPVKPMLKSAPAAGKGEGGE
jgi:Ni,Fe-hydrogenase III component G